MYVSWNWLGDFVSLEGIELEDAVERLTMSGLNHEGTLPHGDDFSIDLEVTSNRPDCLGHIGVAREIAALYQRPLTVKSNALPTGDGGAIGDSMGVDILCPDLCYRFTARLIRGVKVGPSPEWLVKRLQSVIFQRKKDGTLERYQSVNNVADITNYVMFECGQPLHVFDYHKLAGGRIVVREPLAGETLEAIDHHRYDLQPGMCVIADAERAVGLGGVMGGAETEVSHDTVDVLVEAAFFNPLAVRNAARALNLHSPASHRFERTIDSHQIDWASQRCCELILELAGGELVDGWIDAGQSPPPREPVVLRSAQIKRILGIDIPQPAPILDALGFSIDRETEESLTVTPPTWRLDVTREADLIEEVGRIFGYDKVPNDIDVPMAATLRLPRERVVDRVRQALGAAGFDEAMTASLVPAPWSEAFSPWSDAPPLQSSQPMLGVLEKASQNIGHVDCLRRSLVPSLLEAYRINEYKSNHEIELFEMANVYLPNKEGLPDEPRKLALVSQRGYACVKGAVESILAALNPDFRNRVPFTVEPYEHDLLDINYAGQLTLDGQRLGYLGVLSRSGKKRFQIRGDAAIAEIDVALLQRVAKMIPQHRDLSPFPALTRDFNFVVDEALRWDQLESTVRDAAGNELENITLREVYRDKDKRDGENKKRFILSVLLRSAEATLTGKQAEAICHRIVDSCQTQHQAQLLG